MTSPDLITVALLAVASAFAYLIGSLNTSVIISALRGNDIRNHGSKSAGATNMARLFGVSMGVAVLALDACKAFLAMHLVAWQSTLLAIPSNWAEVIVLSSAVFAVLGHVFPIFFRLKGGKGVATGLGVVLFLEPAILAVALALFGIAVLTTKHISVGSLTAVSMYFIGTAIKHLLVSSSPNLAPVVCALIIAAIIIAKHRDNIRRLISGSENKISFPKKK